MWGTEQISSTFWICMVTNNWGPSYLIVKYKIQKTLRENSAVYTAYSCMCVHGLSCLFHAVFLLKWMTRRHCSKFSVVPLSTWTSQNSSTLSSSVVLIHTGVLARCHAATAPCTVSVGWSVIPCVCAFTYLSLSIVFMADMSSSSQSCHSLAVQLSAVANHAHEHFNILEYMEHFRVYTDLRNQGATNMG